MQVRGHAVMVNVGGEMMHRCFHALIGVAHRHAVVHGGQHLQVVVTIAKRHGVAHGDGEYFAHGFDGGSFVDAFGGDFDIVKTTRGDVDVRECGHFGFGRQAQVAV